MFIPGETVAHTFVLPFKPINVHHGVVSYYQNDHVVLEKPFVQNDLIADNENENQCSLNIWFTQDESLLFENPYIDCAKGENFYLVQVNVIHPGGGRSVSVPIKQKTGLQHIREEL